MGDGGGGEAETARWPGRFKTGPVGVTGGGNRGEEEVGREGKS